MQKLESHSATLANVFELRTCELIDTIGVILILFTIRESENFRFNELISLIRRNWTDKFMEITLVSVSERELRVIYMRGCVTFCECCSLSMKKREFSRASMSGTCSRAFCRNKNTATTTTRRKKKFFTHHARKGYRINI